MPFRMITPRNVVVATLGAVISYLLLIRFLLVFSYSLDLDGTEFSFIIFTQFILQGKPLYSNPVEFPYLEFLFTPAYPYLLGFLSKHAGLNPMTDIHEMFVLARAISLLAMLLNLYLLHKLFRTFRLPIEYFLGASAIYLLLITGHFYAVRPDAVKTVLFTAFLYGTIRYSFFEGGHKHLLLAIITGLFSITFRQDTTIYIYLALFILFIVARSKESFRILTFFTAGFISLMAFFYLLFGVEFFINTILMNILVYEHSEHSYNLPVLLFSIGRNLPLILPALFNAYLSFTNPASKTPVKFISISALTFVFVSHLSMLRATSYINYTFEAILLLVLNCALLIQYHEAALGRRRKLLVPAALATYIAALLATNSFIHSYSYSPAMEITFKEQYQSALRERDEISALVSDNLIFIPDFRYALFFSEKNMLYGYQFNLDRILSYNIAKDSGNEFLSNKKKQWVHQTLPKIYFFSGEGYDVHFSNGAVKYLITENSENERQRILTLYPRYTLHKQLNRFAVFKVQEAL